MLSSHNQNEVLKQQAQKHQRFAIKKLSVGVASVLIGLTFMGGSAPLAQTLMRRALRLTSQRLLTLLMVRRLMTKQSLINRKVKKLH